MVKSVRRLYSDFRPENYKLFLEPDRETAVFSGKVVITGKKTGRPSQRITFHQKDLAVKSAKLVFFDKKSGPLDIPIDRINSHQSFDELRLHAKQLLFPGDYQIELEYSGRITAPMHGIYPCNFKLKGKEKQLIATQFESHHAREAFPCIDEPEAKATFDLSLKTPAGEKVIANTPIKSQRKAGNKLLSVFETTPKMSTYLLAFAYGELGYKEKVAKNGVAVRVYATPDNVPLTGFALDTAVRCLDFFEDYFGVAYPLPKQDLIGLPDFSAGAMENWGLITFRESVLYVDPKSTSIETKQYVAMVVCHEMAHMWFGNLVTMKWWNDLWLNESFANLMEYRAVDELYPEWNIWRDFVQREVGSAQARDALPNVQALQTAVHHPDQLTALFDPSIVYAKGGSLLNMVRCLIGEAAFRAGLKSYFEEFKYQNTVAADLWRHLATASGVAIGRLMENWLTKPGFPVIGIDFDRPKQELSLTQRRLIIAPGPVDEPTIWQVPLAASQKLETDILDTKVLKMKHKAAKDYPLTLNHEGRSYFASLYVSKDHFAAILKAVESGVLSPTDRLVLLQSNLLLERAGMVSTLENINLLPAYKNETEETVWAMLTAIIGNAKGLIDKDRKLEERLNSFIRPVVAPLVEQLGWQGANSDTAQTQKLRALALSLAAAAEDQKVLAKGLQLFKNFSQPSDLSADIRGAVYFIGVRFGNKADFDKLISLHSQLSNADEKDEIASELSATRDEARIKQLLAMLKTKDVRRQDVPTWFAWLMRNRYATEAAWDWLAGNWDWVEANYADDKSFDRFLRYAAMVFSKTEQLKRYEAFFEPRLSVAIELPYKLGIEEIEGRIAWRARNEEAVKNWLLNMA